MSGSSPTATTLSVTGAVTTPLALTDATLASQFTPVTVTVNGASYTGASVYSIVSKAGLQFPSAAKNGALLDYLQVTGASGSQVVLSEGEIDPGFGGATSTDIIAYAQNGMAIAPELIVPGDVNGGIGGRDVTGLLNIQAATATVPATAITSASPAPLTISGAVSAAQNPYGLAQIQALGTTTQSDTFLQGTAPKTFTFTGVPLLTALTSAGLTSDIVDSYVLTAGSDGYGVVYSGGEIDPAYRAGATALLAYDDGSGTFPSVGGVDGGFRTTAPEDSKGGRYVSILDTVNVANAGASAALTGYTPGLSGYGTAAALTLNAVLASLSSPVGSVSPDGSSFAAPTASASNIAVVSAPVAGATLALPTGYSAEFLQGSAAATLTDTSVGHALLAANQGNDVAVAFMGSDTVVAGGGADTLFGTAAGDVLVGDSGSNDMVLGAGSESVKTQASSNLIYLGSGPDMVTSNAADTIVGGAGNSTVFAAQGALIYGGGGNMTVVGGASASTVVGGVGGVTLFGAAGGGVAYAGQGGNNFLVGGVGAMTLVGAAGGDVLSATGAAGDALKAGAGSETLVGAYSSGADTYYGGSGSDVIFTGSGAGTVVAGTGSATIVAGTGADEFAFGKGLDGGTDMVFGFKVGTDTVSLSPYGTSLAFTAQSSGSITLGLTDGTQIILQGVTGLASSSIV